MTVKGKLEPIALYFSIRQNHTQSGHWALSALQAKLNIDEPIIRNRPHYYWIIVPRIGSITRQISTISVIAKICIKKQHIPEVRLNTTLSTTVCCAFSISMKVIFITYSKAYSSAWEQLTALLFYKVSMRTLTPDKRTYMKKRIENIEGYSRFMKTSLAGKRARILISCYMYQ